MTKNSISRVELHGASGDDYHGLHVAMESSGFSRYITSGENIIYHLPTGTYQKRVADNVSSINVCDAAKNAAASYWRGRIEVISLVSVEPIAMNGLTPA